MKRLNFLAFAERRARIVPRAPSLGICEFVN